METITFGRWVRYLTREWKHPKDYDTEIAFAIRMATFTPNGGRVFASAPTLAELAGIDERTARRRRKRCIELGMFRETREYHAVPGGGKIKELELALPAHLPPVRTDTLSGLSGGGRAELSGKESDNNRGIEESEVDDRAGLPYRPTGPRRDKIIPTSAHTPPDNSSTVGSELATASERQEGSSDHLPSGAVSTDAHDDVWLPQECGVCRRALWRAIKGELPLETWEIHQHHHNRTFPAPGELQRRRAEQEATKAEPEPVAVADDPWSEPPF